MGWDVEHWRRILGLALIVAVLAAGRGACAQAQSEASGLTRLGPGVHHARAQNGGSLNARVAALAEALHLDAPQQMQLRQVLLWQRAQVQRVWNDPVLSAADRIGATRAVAREATQRMRGFLNTQQRALLDPPEHPTTQVAAATPRPVQDWMHFIGSEPAPAASANANGAQP